MQRVMQLTREKAFITFPVEGGILGWQRQLRYRNRSPCISIDGLVLKLGDAVLFPILAFPQVRQTLMEVFGEPLAPQSQTIHAERCVL